jgi:NADH dehydrogenase FAD-containing subunit
LVILLLSDPKMANLKDQLFQQVADESQPRASNKVTIVGTGAVGMAAAFSILAQVKKLNLIFQKFRHQYEIFPTECFE